MVSRDEHLDNDELPRSSKLVAVVDALLSFGA
jgi:hypothetical protein